VSCSCEVDEAPSTQKRRSGHLPSEITQRDNALCKQRNWNTKTLQKHEKKRKRIREHMCNLLWVRAATCSIHASGSNAGWQGHGWQRDREQVQERAKSHEACKGDARMQEGVGQKQLVRITGWKALTFLGGESRGTVTCLLENFKENW
jgi:hypothetical protein